MSEYQPKGRTSITKRWLEVGGTLHQITHLGPEPTATGYDYQVETFKIKGELGDVLDAALVTIGPAGWTPPQRVDREGLILDFPMKGDGYFVCMYPHGTLWIKNFNDRNSDQNNRAFFYRKGCFIFWKAGPRGLTFVEVCSPPYKLGDLKNLDINSSEVPIKFKGIYKKMVDQILLPEGY
ncbi:hypothetical protein HYT59_02715 [Candidatus Woesebacteria bacterium]|nr:hypothetical protein [Candidatus Woesebacteria bacterium]